MDQHERAPGPGVVSRGLSWDLTGVQSIGEKADPRTRPMGWYVNPTQRPTATASQGRSGMGTYPAAGTAAATSAVPGSGWRWDVTVAASQTDDHPVVTCSGSLIEEQSAQPSHFMTDLLRVGPLTRDWESITRRGEKLRPLPSPL